MRDGRSWRPSPLPSTPRSPAPRRLVVFVHGLMETEHAWRPGAARVRRRLERELGRTPVDVRDNRGRHISHNGRSLAELLEALVAAWPVELRRSRSSGTRWAGWWPGAPATTRSRTVTPGSPTCATSSRWARRTWAPRSPRASTTPPRAARGARDPPVGRLLRRRSAGIRDLRQGSLVDRDWEGCDPDALRAAACAEVPLLAGATHCFVTATVTRDAHHPVGRLIGDALGSAQRLRPQPHPADPVPRGGRPARGRRAPSCAPQPPRGVRAAAAVAGALGARRPRRRRPGRRGARRRRLARAARTGARRRPRRRRRGARRAA